MERKTVKLFGRWPIKNRTGASCNILLFFFFGLINELNKIHVQKCSYNNRTAMITKTTKAVTATIYLH